MSCHFTILIVQPYILVHPLHVKIHILLQDDTCKFNKTTVGATVTGFVDIQSGSEDALQKAAATIGPISVAIDASHWSFQFYHRGVYDEWLCSSSSLDHGVLVVGYDATAAGDKYWVVKNR